MPAQRFLWEFLKPYQTLLGPFNLFHFICAGTHDLLRRDDREIEGGMTRGDFWCRVLGWLQIGGAVATGLLIYSLWALFFGWIEMNDDGFFVVIMWIIIIVLCLSAPSWPGC